MAVMTLFELAERLGGAVVGDGGLEIRGVRPLGDAGGEGMTLKHLPRALALAVAMPLGQYLGARSADSGRELLRVRGV